MCSYFFNFRSINAIFRPPKKLDLEQWPQPLFKILGYSSANDPSTVMEKTAVVHRDLFLFMEMFTSQGAVGFSPLHEELYLLI